MKPSPKLTHEGRLIQELTSQIDKAKKALESGKPSHALIELEYSEVIVNDTFAEHPEIRNVFYR